MLETKHASTTERLVYLFDNLLCETATLLLLSQNPVTAVHF